MTCGCTRYCCRCEKTTIYVANEGDDCACHCRECGRMVVTVNCESRKD